MWVADVATGPGYAAAAAVNRGAEVVGVDFSSTQLAFARKLYPDLEELREDSPRVGRFVGRIALISNRS
jgi:SAM-dependent methyltransferase